MRIGLALGITSSAELMSMRYFCRSTDARSPSFSFSSSFFNATNPLNLLKSPLNLTMASCFFFSSDRASSPGAKILAVDFISDSVNCTSSPAPSKLLLSGSYTTFRRTFGCVRNGNFRVDTANRISSPSTAVVCDAQIADTSCFE